MVIEKCSLTFLVADPLEDPCASSSPGASTPSQRRIRLCSSLLHNCSSLGDHVSSPAYLTLEEVVARYRGQVSKGTLRNWRAMRIGPSFIKIGKAVLYPVTELERWDKSNLVVCRPSRSLPLEGYASVG
jgi:hypothetical protein